MVPGPHAPTGASPVRPRHLWTAIAVVVALLVTVLVAGAQVRIPYFSIAPGEARDIAPLIAVDGVDTYEAGDILFLTISLNHVTLLEGALGWADRDVDVIPEAVILGTGTEDENRQVNRLAMDSSKDAAQVVALTRLGYELNPTGTGAVITEISAGTPAEAVLQIGETLTAVDGQPVLLPADLGALITDRQPGDVVVLTIETLDDATGQFTERQEQVSLVRCGDIPSCLEGRPDEPDSALLGVASQPRNFDPGLPFAVGIDSGDVGGPSAGLAFTLSLLDVLTPGDLTGGHRIAVTGTIRTDGTVGDVGGVVQKAAAAADSGADVMLVPRGEEAEALANPHGMQIIAVDDLDDALRALESVGGAPLPEGARPAPAA
ncbi:MAG: PDZ domain-containing protein [Acidimicrobiia bacterium]|nr:PDZ domain-containing protein [Acidimicrobiia bacterium]